MRGHPLRATLVLASAVSAISLTAYASGLERFSQFINGTQSATGEFEQKIFDKSGRIVQESAGTLAFSRPGKFRWTYVKPYAQLLVGDGARVWIFDPDLKQVTVKKMHQALGSTPAALLAGNNEAVRAFRLSDLGTRDGREWLEAVPRDKEGAFEKIRMGFGFSGPEIMEFYDNFGQKTVVRFASFQRNPKLDASLFRFSPPKGADVIGE